MPDTKETRPAANEAKPNAENTQPEATPVKVENSAATLIAKEMTQADKAPKATPQQNNAPAAIEKPRPAPQPRKAPTVPRQTMHFKAARGTTTHLPPPNRRRRYVDESVPQVRTEYRHGSDAFSYAYFKRACFFYSDPAQMYFERNFQRVDRALQMISLICGIIGNPEVAERRTKEAETLAKTLETKLIKAIENLQRQMNDKNIPEDEQVPSYDHKRQYTPALHTPQAVQFVTIVSLFDRLVARLDGAWFNAIMKRSDTKAVTEKWLEELNNYISALNALRSATLQEARNSGNQQRAKAVVQRVEEAAKRVEEDHTNDTIESKTVAVEPKTTPKVKADTAEKPASPVKENTETTETASAGEPQPQANGKA